VARQLCDLYGTPVSLETPRSYTVLWARKIGGSDIQTARGSVGRSCDISAAGVQVVPHVCIWQGQHVGQKSKWTAKLL
jgi:hypothetical protein